MHTSHLSFHNKSLLTVVAFAGAALMPAQTTPQSLPNSTTPGQANPNSTRPTTTIPSATNPNSSGQPIPGANPAANADTLAVSPGNSHLTAKETQFITDALQGGRSEVAMAHIAMTKGTSAELKSYARRLMDDHTAANAKLEAIASKNGISIGGGDAHSGVLTSSDVAGGARTSENSSAGHGSLASTPSAGQSSSSSASSAANQNSRSSAVHSSSNTDAAGSVHGNMDSHLSGLSGSDFDRAFAKQMVDDHERTIAKFEAAQNDITDTELRGFIASTLPTLRQHLEQARALNK